MDIDSAEPATDPTLRFEAGDYLPMFQLDRLNMESKSTAPFFLVFISRPEVPAAILGALGSSSSKVFIVSRTPTARRLHDPVVYDFFASKTHAYTVYWVGLNLKIRRVYTFDEPDFDLVLPATQRDLAPPILRIPDAITPALAEACLRLFDQRAAHVDDAAHKSRMHVQADARLIEKLDEKFCRSVFPEVEKVFYQQITYRETWKVCRYWAEAEGKFAAHRDTIPPYSHRRFGLSLALDDGYEGGGIVFPEYSEVPVALPKYTAVVFPGTLFHEVKPVTRGVRSVIISFLFTDKEGLLKNRPEYKCKATRDLGDLTIKELF
jgi:hypothetical protein